MKRSNPEQRSARTITHTRTHTHTACCRSAVDPADFEVVVAEAASGALLSPAVYRFEVSADGLPPGFLSAVGFVLEAGSLSLVLRRVSDPHRQALASATVTVTVSCSRGRYPATASACEPCPADTFSLDFSSVCTPCPDGGSAPAGSGSCACNLGFYRVVDNGAPAVFCSWVGRGM